MTFEPDDAAESSLMDNLKAADAQYAEYTKLVQIAQSASNSLDRPVYFAPLPGPMTLAAL